MERGHTRELIAVIPRRIAEGFKNSCSGKGEKMKKL